MKSSIKRYWKKINGYPYKVSNFGRVKSLPRIRKNGFGKRLWKGKILTPRTNRKGYKFIHLSFPGGQKIFYIHRLVLEYFGPPKPSPKHQCNHKDGNKENNHISNLEWVTPSENMKHSYKKGLR